MYPQRNTQPDTEAHVIRIQGAGAADPTVELGNGVTVTHEGTGQYRITWSDTPGNYRGAVTGLQGSTPSALMGHTVVFDEYDASNLQLDVYFQDETQSAANLASGEYITMVIFFSSTAVAGA